MCGFCIYFELLYRINLLAKKGYIYTMSEKKVMTGIEKEPSKIGDKGITWILFLFTFLISAIMGIMLNVACVLDETGVVANAAYVAGYNWNDWVSATGGYFYKYGSALLYIPILKIFNNPYIIYKLIMIVNSILVAIVPVCAYRILRRHLLVEDKKLCAVTAFAVGIVPSSVLYSLSAKADVALITWTWVLLLVILESITVEKKYQQYIFSVLIVLVSVYLYMCHTRGIVFVIAAFMTVFAMRFILKKRSVKISAYVVALALCLLMDNNLTSFFKHSIWGNGKTKNTMEGYKFDKFRKMLSFTGAETLIKNTASWFFDTIIGNYGFVVIGLFFALFIIVRYLKKKDISQKEFIISLYSVLVFIGTMALGILFFFRNNFKLMAETSSSRVDRMFYSRYMSPAYAILILVAIYYLFIKTDRFTWKSKLFTVIFSGAVIIFVWTWIYPLTENCGFSWRNVLDCGLFYQPEYFGKDAGSYSGPGIADALMKGAILGFVLMLLFIWLSLKNIQRKKAVVCMIAMCFMVNLVSNFVKLRFNADMRTMNVCGSVFTEMEGIVDQYETITEKFNDIYYDSTSSAGYKFYQMGFPNFNVCVKKRAKFEEIENAFIVAKTQVVNELWMAEDCYLLKDYDYDNSVNAIIVKGDALKSALEAHGIEVVEMPQDYGTKERNAVPADYWTAVKNSFRYQIESFQN